MITGSSTAKVVAVCALIGACGSSNGKPAEEADDSTVSDGSGNTSASSNTSGDNGGSGGTDATNSGGQTDVTSTTASGGSGPSTTGPSTTGTPTTDTASSSGGSGGASSTSTTAAVGGFGGYGDANCDGDELPTEVVVAEGCAAQEPGAWVDVTPEALRGAFINSLVKDPVRPSDVYVTVDHEGVWKSVDCGASWGKVATGDLAVGTGGWSMAIDPNPCRDPATPPALYITQGAGGLLGLWKSVDGGVTWNDVWTDNIFAPDGSNISADVGKDVGSVQIPDPRYSEFLVAYLHGYFGSGGNNGIFVSTDAGATWTVQKSQTFEFQPHSTLLYALDDKNWLVNPGNGSSDTVMYRTNDSGVSWTPMGEAPIRGLAHPKQVARVGDILYTGTDFQGGVAKSTDQGQSWSVLPNSGGRVFGVAVTDTKVYACDGYGGAVTIKSADRSDETQWTSTELGVSDTCGPMIGPIFNGSNNILVGAVEKSGIWRFVEP